MATKKKAATPAKKAAPAKVKVTEKKGGKIQEILALHQKGKTLEQIVAGGYNKTTASIQISKFKKANG